MSHRSYQSHRSRLAEAAAAEQAAAEKARQAEAEQAALDAAQRAKVAELSGAVRAALAAGDLQTAGERLSELAEVAGDTSSLVAELRAEYESKAGERETNSRYASASVERDKAAALDRGQTFGAKLDALEIKWREAEAARQGRSWGQALSGYDAVLSQCRALHELDAERQTALAERAKAEQAQRAAAGNNAAADAKTLFDSAGEATSRADQAFEAGDFSTAAKSWTEAVALFGQSGERARSVQAYARAKTAYETAFAADRTLLEQHGGEKWQEVLRQSRIGAASGNDPATGSDAYAKALAGLPEAVTEARTRERAVQAEAVAVVLRERIGKAEAAKGRAAWDEALTLLGAPRPAEPFASAFVEEPLRGLFGQLDTLRNEVLAGQRAAQVEAVAVVLRERIGRAETAKTRAAWDEALTLLGAPRPAEPFAGAFGDEPLRGLLGQLDALKTESLAGQRAARIEAHVAAARRAKEADRWSEVVASAGKALELDANNREAQALKREGEASLIPTWRLVATVDGREVPATVSMGGQTHQTPHTFKLQEGKTYTAEFSYEAGGRAFLAEPVLVTADWKGERSRRIALLEIRGPVARRNATVEGLGLELVWVAPGSFRMGSNDGSSDEKPVRDVRITRGYWLGKYEVTQSEYEAVMGNNPSYFKDAREPVENVSWTNAVEFCLKLTERERAAGRLPAGYEYRLPTEAEWEYAARGGAQSRGYTNAGSNSVDESGWYVKNSGGVPHQVGRKKPNELGLYDMSGNVDEWCLDWYDEAYYGRAPVTDPVNTVAATSRVVRGGSWNVPAGYLRSALRNRCRPAYRIIYNGFRVALAPLSGPR